MKVRLTRQAQQDFDEAVQWFAVERPWLVDEFLDKLKEAFELLLKNPEAGPRVEFPVATGPCKNSCVS